MKTSLQIIGMLIILLSNSQPVLSHGTVVYPASRIYNCYLNPSTPICEPCGTMIYDWMSVLQPHTNYGDHPAYVPDGQIASGGNGGGDFSCLDALSADWPATTVSTGAIDVKWENKAPHRTEYYKVYITPLTWDPTQPLRWGDLIEIGHVGKRPAEAFTTITSYIPDTYAGKRAALVSVWQRDYSHSHEAFYAVSDIYVSGNGGCNTGDTVSVAFANNTDCMLEYYQNNILQGSATAGASYSATTTVGSQWEARKTTGEQFGSFTIACGQSGYTSTGTCTTGCSAGDTVSVTFANNTDCTLEYYLNSTLQGSAIAGGSYAASTTAGSQWEARKTTGEPFNSFAIACDLPTYTSTGSCSGSGGECAPAYGPYPNVYMTGQQASYNGRNYECQIDNLYNVTPGTAAHWWKDLGPCSTGGGCTAGDPISVTFANNTDCTLEYYLNNVLQGSAIAGASYASNTTAESQWEARKTTGELFSSITITCGQPTYTSSGTCNSGTGTCAQAYGPYPNIYMINQEVSHNGRNYKCLVDNLFNVTPGTAAHWWEDLGPCSSGLKSGVDNIEVLNGGFNFVAYPNPAKDIINLEILNPRASEYTIAIKGIDGRTLETQILEVSESSDKAIKSIKLDKLSPGIYFINVNSGNNTRTQRILVK